MQNVYTSAPLKFCSCLCTIILRRFGTMVTEQYDCITVKRSAGKFHFPSNRCLWMIRKIIIWRLSTSRNMGFVRIKNDYNNILHNYRVSTNQTYLCTIYTKTYSRKISGRSFLLSFFCAFLSFKSFAFHPLHLPVLIPISHVFVFLIHCTKCYHSYGQKNNKKRASKFAI